MKDYEVYRLDEGWLPCPLCGTVKIGVEGPVQDDAKWKASCMSCGLRVVGCMSEDELRSRWNTRPDNR